MTGLATAAVAAAEVRSPVGRGARVEYFRSVDGMIVYDVPGAPSSGGGTRLAPDITESEMRLLARCMTYKLAVLELRVGGAKIGLRAAAEERTSVIARFRAEIAGRLQSGELMTGPDLGTSEADFAGLPTPGGDDGVATEAVGGLPAEELLTGIGVASALEAALPGGLDGRTIALQGFGKMGASIARAVDARGGRIVAVSTLAGCAVAPPGQWFPVAQLLEARDAWGDHLVHHLRARAHPRYALWAASCDALVPGARPGSLNRHTARHVAAGVVVPVANAPYTAGGLDTLEARGIEAHADFVTSGGGAMAYLAPAVAQADGVDAARDAIDAIMHAIVEETRAGDIRPYAGAAAMAERFLATWLPDAGRPAGRPLA